MQTAPPSVLCRIPSLLKDASKVYQDMDFRGVPISRLFLQESIACEEAKLATLLKASGTISTKEFKHKMDAWAKTQFNWPVGEKGHPLLNEKLAVRRKATELQAYCEASSINRFLSTLKRFWEDTGLEPRLFPVHNIRPDLGRVYVGNFNYTNLPKGFRPLVLAEKGHSLWTLDCGRVELWMMAVMANDTVLKEDLLASDFHRAFAARLARVDVSLISDEARENAKTTVYTILFGGTAPFLAEELGLSEVEAASLIDGFFGLYAKSKALIDQVGNTAERTGTALSYFLTSRTFPKDGDVRKSAVSHTFQSSAGEMVRAALPMVASSVEAVGGRVWGVLFDSYQISLPDTCGQDFIDSLFKYRIFLCRHGTPRAHQVNIHWLLLEVIISV